MQQDAQLQAAEVKHNVEQTGRRSKQLLSSYHICFCCVGAELKQQAGEAVDAAKDAAQGAANDLKPVVHDAKEAGMFA